MAQYQHEFAGDDDASRCMAARRGIQCINKKMEGSNYCAAHGGIMAQITKKKTEYNNYKLQVYQERVSQFAENDKVKSLREEIGILRLTLETIINQMDGNPSTLIAMSGKISDMILKIEKVVSTTHRLEQSLGLVLDKQTIITLADGIVNIISSKIDDPEIVALVAEGITSLIMDIGNVTKDAT